MWFGIMSYLCEIYYMYICIYNTHFYYKCVSICKNNTQRSTA
jgi:hypothetical protein